MFTQRVRQTNWHERVAMNINCTSRRFLEDVFGDVCVSSERVNKRGFVVLYNSRLMSLQTPSGPNGRFTGSYETLPIFTSASFFAGDRNLFQLKPDPCQEEAGIGEWQLRRVLIWPRSSEARWALGPAPRGESFAEPSIKAYIIHFLMAALLKSVLLLFFSPFFNYGIFHWFRAKSLNTQAQSVEATRRAREGSSMRCLKRKRPRWRRGNAACLLNACLASRSQLLNLTSTVISFFSESFLKDMKSKTILLKKTM